MQLTITHSTRYKFDTPVNYGLQQLRKTPKSSHQQEVLSWATEVTGGRKELAFDDYHNNLTELISFDRDTHSLDVISRGVIRIEDTTGLVGPHRGPSPLWLYERATPLTKAGSGSRRLLRELDSTETLEQLHELSGLLRGAIAYQLGTSESDWSAEDAIEAGKGVCQDHTHAFLACARELGVPARYVSGYLMMDDRTAQDAMHAWAEAHVEGLGWVGFDISNGISPDFRYVRVATGLDYRDAAPVSGTQIGGSGEALDVTIEVAQQ